MGKKAKEKQREYRVQLSMAENVATLDVTGFIGWDTDPLTFTEKVAQAKEAGCTQLRVRINSLGGYCYDGLAMGDALKTCGMETVGTVLGTAQSMASYILQCCERREAHKNATIMVHQPSAGVCGTVDEILTQAQYLCALRDKMFADMAERCGTTGPELSAEHMTMKLYSAEEALKKGFIDKITGAEGEATEEEATEEEAAEKDATEATACGVYEYQRVQMALAMVADAEEDATEEEATEEEATEEEGAEPAVEQELFPEEATEEEATEEEATEEDATKEDATKEDATKEDATKEDATKEDATEEDATEEKPLTREEVAAMIAEREAAMWAELGVPRAALPSVVEGGAPVSAKGGNKPSMAELDAMPGMQRVEVLAADPELARAYALHV